MEHARKMVLVPEESLSQLTAQNQRQTATVDSEPQAHRTFTTVLSRLDAEMKDILDSHTYKGEREKWSAYLTVLQRYLHFADSERLQHLTTIVKKTEPSVAGDRRKSENFTGMNDSIIIESVPLKFRNKAKLLLRCLHDAPTSNFSWDSAGVVSVGGHPIKDSNIVDLVNDAMRARKVPKPTGREAFARFLRTMQAPREFIGNEDLWLESRASSSLRRRSSRSEVSTDNDGDDDDNDNGAGLSDIRQSTFFSGSESNISDSSVQQRGSGSKGHYNKKRRLTWVNLKLKS